MCQLRNLQDRLLFIVALTSEAFPSCLCFLKLFFFIMSLGVPFTRINIVVFYLILHGH